MGYSMAKESARVLLHPASSMNMSPTADWTGGYTPNKISPVSQFEQSRCSGIALNPSWPRAARACMRVQTPWPSRPKPEDHLERSRQTRCTTCSGIRNVQ